MMEKKYIISPILRSDYGHQRKGLQTKINYTHQMINWGIIGCGNVTEVKSGPAFNKVKDSRLIAVMRRNRIAG